jgi:RNase P subunit RPR2
MTQNFVLVQAIKSFRCIECHKPIIAGEMKVTNLVHFDSNRFIERHHLCLHCGQVAVLKEMERYRILAVAIDNQLPKRG